MSKTNAKIRELKKSLVRKGVTQVSIAFKLGIYKQHISAVLNGTRKTHRIRVALCRAAGMRLEEVWPEE